MRSLAHTADRIELNLDFKAPNLSEWIIALRLFITIIILIQPYLPEINDILTFLVEFIKGFIHIAQTVSFEVQMWQIAWSSVRFAVG